MEEDLKTLGDTDVEPSADPAPAAEAPAEADTQATQEAAAPEAPPEAPPLDRTEKGSESPDAEPMELGDTPDDSRKVEVQADWPDDWRNKLANGDEKLMKRLERFSSPDKILQSWLAAEQKISSGEYKKDVDLENATPEEIAAWRAEQGVPEDASAYKLPDNYEWNEADHELFGKVFEHMHKTNATQEQINAVANGYIEVLETMNEARAQADREFLQEQEDALRTKLGDEYRPQINVFKRVLQDPEGPIAPDVVQQLMSARGEDGNRLINNAGVAQWLIEQGLNHYGDGALISGDAKATMTSRIDEIRQIMNTDFDRYMRENLDQEYTQLLDRQAGRRGGSQGPNYYDD